ncbi:MAG: hypothetical protein FWF97_02730 [Alphaproteobacteria bacterium]|nr:hypothetical protein [Alphaproteobacteria bacterium]
MKKSTFALCSLLFALCATSVAHAAVQITKAAPVSTQQQEKGMAGLMSGNSLIPTALGLVGNVMAMSQAQAALSAECEPTDGEVAFVKTLMQEWAKAGGAMPNLGARPKCVGRTYADSVRILAEGIEPCYQVFDGTMDSYQIYANYPYPSKGYRLKDPAGPNNDKNRAAMSDIYQMLGGIGFEDADFMPNEVAMMARLKEKSLTCAPAVLSAKQRELWGAMLTQTVGGLGQKQNAGATMGQVGSVLQQGGGSPLNSMMGALPVLSGSLFGGQ